MFVSRAAAYFVVLTENLAAADPRILVESLAPTPHSLVTLSSQYVDSQYVDYGNAGWCYGGSDEYVGRSQNAAACWSMCVDSSNVEDLIAIDWWPYGYAGGQYRTCFCQFACTCLAEVGAGNTLLVATSFAELNGLPATCEFATPSPTAVGEDPVVYRRIIFICAGAATLIICVILLLKTPALNFEESGEELCAATEASRATTAADAQAAAAQALAARLESAPTTKFSRVLAAATDPAGVDATCAICLVDMESADFVKRLPTCHHCYHADCLNEWLRVSELCPLCKTSVLPPSHSNSASVASTPAQSPVNTDLSPNLNDYEADRSQPSSLPPTSGFDPSTSTRYSTSAAPPLQPGNERSRASHAASHGPHRSSSRPRGTSLDDSTLEMVPVSSRPSRSSPRHSSLSPRRQASYQARPTGGERRRTSSSGGASAETHFEGPRRTQRRQPSRTARQQHRRAVSAATAATRRH